MTFIYTHNGKNKTQTGIADLVQCVAINQKEICKLFLFVMHGLLNIKDNGIFFLKETTNYCVG